MLWSWLINIMECRSVHEGKNNVNFKLQRSSPTDNRSVALRSIPGPLALPSTLCLTELVLFNSRATMALSSGIHSQQWWPPGRSKMRGALVVNSSELYIRSLEGKRVVGAKDVARKPRTCVCRQRQHIDSFLFKKQPQQKLWLGF